MDFRTELKVFLEVLLRPILTEILQDNLVKVQHQQATTATSQENDLVKVGEIATLTGFKQGYIYELVRNGAIPHHRVGRSLRFSKKEVLDWIKTGKHEKREATEKYVADYSIKKTLQGKKKGGYKDRKKSKGVEKI